MRKRQLISESMLHEARQRSQPPQQKQPRQSNQALLQQLGSARSMPEQVQSRMEQSMGADFSGVRLFESPLIAEKGAQAVASGNNIAFAPGQLDFGSAQGLSLLGHELSHVASQARGEVTGSGLVNDSALEHRADLEGAQAASAFDSLSGATLTPLSAGPAPASSAAPVQAKKGKKKLEPADMEIAPDDAEMGQQSADALEAISANGYNDPGTFVDTMMEFTGQNLHSNFRNGTDRTDMSNQIEVDKVNSIYKHLGDNSRANTMQKFLDVLKQRQLTAARKMTKLYNKNLKKYGSEGAGLHTKYSDEADTFTNVQEVIKSLGMESQNRHNGMGVSDAISRFKTDYSPEDNAMIQNLYDNVVMMRELHQADREDTPQVLYASAIGEDGLSNSERLANAHADHQQQKFLGWKRSWMKKRRGRR